MQLESSSKSSGKLGRKKNVGSWQGDNARVSSDKKPPEVLGLFFFFQDM